jgi:hypothetical protein
MANAEVVRLAPDAPQERIISAVNSLIDGQLGNAGARVLMVGHDGTSTDPNLGTSTGTGLYQTVIRSSGTNHLQVRKADDSADRLTVTDTATTADALVVTTTGTFTGAATFNADVNIGDASADTLTVKATASFENNVTLGNAVGDTLTVNATTTFAEAVTFTTGKVVTGNGTAQFKGPLSALATANLVLTTTLTNITGATLSLSPGVWAVTGVFHFVDSADVGQVAAGTLAVTAGTATVALPGAGPVFTFAVAGMQQTVSAIWLVTVTATATVFLQAKKYAGAGASYVSGAGWTTITATNA